MILHGIGVSHGIAIAKAVVIRPYTLEFEEKCKDPELEVRRFLTAHSEALADNKQLYEKMMSELGEEKASIFLAHEEILSDEEGVIEPITIRIKEFNSSAEAAIAAVLAEFIETFADIEDEYLKERAQDFEDVQKKLINALNQKGNTYNFAEDVIVIAKDLTPSDTARFDLEKVKGIAIEIGGRTSHTSILTQAMELPAIVGATDILQYVEEGQTIIIDGASGEICIEPTLQETLNYQERAREHELAKKHFAKVIGMKTILIDGQSIELAANITEPADAKNAVKYGAEGVGLFRSEFLYLGRDDLPSEEEQYLAYKAVLKTMDGKPVIVRTIDIGGDKECPSFNLVKEENPFLGLRAIRLCIKRQDVFTTQLRALARSSAHGKLLIMFPMISDLNQLELAKDLLKQAIEDVHSDGHVVADHIPVGMMVEIPEAAIMSDVFARKVDFFSIGSNDLIQYTAAVDRGNPTISELYSNYNPGLLRLVHLTIKNAHTAKIFCGICGEAASDKLLIPFLIGCGLDEFSVTPSLIPLCRERILCLSREMCKPLVDKVLVCNSKESVLKVLMEFSQEL